MSKDLNQRRKSVTFELINKKDNKDYFQHTKEVLEIGLVRVFFNRTAPIPFLIGINPYFLILF